MKTLETICKTKRGKVAPLSNEYSMDPADYIASICEGDPIKSKEPGKKRASTVTEYHYLIDPSMVLVRAMIAEIKSWKYKDVTAEQKTKLGKKEFSYLISAEPSDHFYSIKVVTDTGKSVCVCNAENYVRNAGEDPEAAAETIREIWRQYPNPAMTIAGIAEREYLAYLHEAGCYFDFRDNHREHIEMYDCELHEYAYNAYFGGWCYDATGGNTRVNDGIRLDVHSLYPWVMSQGLPADRYIKECMEEWTFNAWKDRGDCGYIVHFTCRFHVKHGAFPFVSYRNGSLITHNATDSGFDMGQKHIDRDIEMWMVKPEYEAFWKLYDVKKFVFMDAIFFPVVRDAKPYIEEKYRLKQSLKDNKYRYIVAKTIMNGLSGIFARRSEMADTVFNENMEPETVYMKTKKASHVLQAAWITGTGRARMATLAAENYDRFLYCDTDSLHLTGTEVPENCRVSDALGDFALEAMFTGAIYWGQKKYAEWSDDAAKVVMAGLPQVYIDVIQEQLVGGRLTARRPLSWQLLYGDIAKDIIAGKNVEIPYKVDGSGWMLYRTKKVRKTALNNDNARALYLIERARQEAKELNDTFWE